MERSPWAPGAPDAPGEAQVWVPQTQIGPFTARIFPPTATSPGLVLCQLLLGALERRDGGTDLEQLAAQTHSNPRTSFLVPSSHQPVGFNPLLFCHFPPDPVWRQEREDGERAPARWCQAPGGRRGLVYGGQRF